MDSKKDRILRKDSLIVAASLLRHTGYGEEGDPSDVYTVTLPHLPFVSFDNTGEKILPWHLMELLNSGAMKRSLAIVLRNPELFEHLTVFFLYYELEIDRSFYDINTPKCPLIMEYRGVYIKSSSRLTRTTLGHPTQSKPYVTTDILDVRVDPITRKPLPFPVTWKERINRNSRISPKSRGKYDEMPCKNNSTRVLVTKHTVAFSDSDLNGHANNTYFTRIAYDSFVENLIAGRLKLGAERHFENGLRKVQVSFKKECVLGDILTVESWVDDVSDDVYYFEILKAGELSARLTFVFHNTLERSMRSKL